MFATFYLAGEKSQSNFVIVYISFLYILDKLLGKI